MQKNNVCVTDTTGFTVCLTDVNAEVNRCYYWNVLFFLFGLVERQDYFIHFKPSQLEGGAQMGDLRENTHLTTPKVELGLSHMCPELGSNSQQRVDAQSRVMKISGLKYSATGPSNWKCILSEINNVAETTGLFKPALNAFCVTGSMQ